MAHKKQYGPITQGLICVCTKDIVYQEFKMNEEASEQWIKKGLPDKYPSGEIYIYGGKLYRDVLNSYFENTIELIGRNRGIGDHFSELLKFVHEYKPRGVLPI